MSTTHLGRLGEQLAVRHLRSLGYAILDRNWRCSVDTLRGELDVIARDGSTLVVVEVKTRRGTAFGHPVEAVTPAKLRQVRRLAGVWLAQSAVGERAVRVDVVGIVIPDTGGRPEVTHLQDVS